MVDRDWKEGSERLVGRLSFVDFRASCWVSREPGCSCFALGWKQEAISLIILRNLDVAYLILVLTAGGSQFYIYTFYLWRHLILNKRTYGVVSTYGVGVYIWGRMTEWKRKDIEWGTRFTSNGEEPNMFTWKRAWLIRKYKEVSIYVHNYGINTIYGMVSTYRVVSTYRDGWGSEEGKKGNTKYVAALYIQCTLGPLWFRAGIETCSMPWHRPVYSIT